MRIVEPRSHIPPIPQAGAAMNAPPIQVVRAWAYQLPADERAPLLSWLRFVERLTTPPRTVELGRFPDAQERRRRALMARPNPYFPGGPDYRGYAS